MCAIARLQERCGWQQSTSSREKSRAFGRIHALRATQKLAVVTLRAPTSDAGKMAASHKKQKVKSQYNSNLITTLPESFALPFKMKIFTLTVALFAANHVSVGNAWSTSSGLFPRRAQVPSLRKVTARLASTAATAKSDGDEAAQLSPAGAKKQERRKQIKEEGGPLAFNTKYGALNPFAIYYGLTAIVLGLPWLMALIVCQLLYVISGNRIDKYVSGEMSCCLSGRDDTVEQTALRGTSLLLFCFA